MSTTPRTDAARGFYDMDTAVSAEDMAQLETEFTEAKASFKEERQFLIAEIKEQMRELARLRTDLERFTGHGLLDCHAICDQRDAAVAERDRLRAENESSCKVLRQDAEHNAARAEMAEASAKLWEADALRYANNTEFWQSRAQKAEAALAAAVDGVIDGGNCREKMLYIHVPGDARGHMMGQPVKVILPAVDAAMKEASK
jgi:hypothetical protein